MYTVVLYLIRLIPFVSLFFSPLTRANSNAFFTPRNKKQAVIKRQQEKRETPQLTSSMQQKRMTRENHTAPFSKVVSPLEPSNAGARAPEGNPTGRVFFFYVGFIR